MPNFFNERLVKAMRSNDIADIDQAVMFLRHAGLNYQAVRARFNQARREAGLPELSEAEHDNLMLACDELE